jgi:hypothetical protein
MNDNFLPKGAPLLNLNSPTFAEDLATLLGISPGDRIDFYGPQFNRTDGIVPEACPSSPEEWKELHNSTHEALTAKGLGVWDKTDTYTHYLFPAEWYNFLPNGLQVTDICGNTEGFQAGVTDDDRRCGMLAFGFLKEL